jgi:hypothetical protein
MGLTGRVALTEGVKQQYYSLNSGLQDFGVSLVVKAVEGRMRIYMQLGRCSPALGLLLLAGPALADSIDGSWCHRDGRRFSIHGPEIVTPGGTRMAGNYDRHGFSYVVPTPEKGAGKTVEMMLANENTVYLRHSDSEQETWLRCSPSTSSLNGVLRS